MYYIYCAHNKMFKNEECSGKIYRPQNNKVSGIYLSGKEIALLTNKTYRLQNNRVSGIGKSFKG